MTAQLVNPQQLPNVWHALTWAPFGRHAGWHPCWLCSACDADLGDDAAAAHMAATQWTSGSQPAPVAVDRPLGHADERDEA